MNINTGSRRLITALGIALLSLLSVAAKEHTVVFTAAQGDPDGKVTICEETNNLNSAETFTKTNEYVKLEVAAKKGTAVYSDQIVLPYGSNTSHSKITISRLKEGASITGIRLVMRDGDEGNLEVTNSESAKVGITPQGDIWKVNGIDWRDFSVDDVDPQKIVISVINRSVIIREIEVTYDDGIPVPTYKVNVGDAPNATVTVNDKAPENVEIGEGQEANIQVKADEGYVITSVSVNGDKYLYDGQQQVSFTRKMTDNLNITVETEAIGMGTITISPAEHTTISVSYDGQAVETGSSLAIGSQIIVSVRAEDGYRLTEAKIGETPMTISDNGSSAMATHTLSGDIIISCTAEECTYAVTVECPESASIIIDDKEPAEMGVAKLGDKLRIFVKAKTGFFISSVAISGQTSTFSNQSEATFEHTVTGPVTITVTTTAIPQGGITWTADDGATVTVTHKGSAIEQGAKLANGETIVVTVRAKEDYRLRSFSVNGTDMLTQLNEGNGTMTLTVNGDMQIQAGSEKYRFAATVDADPAQIEVWADGQQLTTGRKFDKDDKVEITVKAKTGYSLNKATIGGVALNITEEGSQAKVTHTVS
ncbi:MAG: hypothetical protein J6C91_06920, partial [Muribaculaceae bacterium]|nr:hypothetical protein [Muribaculaceae bacterium]